MKSALVLGASGLVGRQLLQLLLDDPRYGSVTCLLRRPLATQHYRDPHRKLQPVVINFDDPEAYQGYFTVDHVYCCLGTTLKRAGSKQAFRKVDFEYVHVAAQLARAQRAKGFVWISAVGANAKSKHFYLRVKGELENAILRMPQLEHAAAVRPSVLIGEREGDERMLERMTANTLTLLKPIMVGPLKKYRAVYPELVAREMISLQPFS
ncbi:NAD-dependent epimerase/dehydratase family protein [Aestuariibacter sp. GS-14]|uniref:NAD-dependent epimerase/dehydratase family protein n=1 Tax=Aestuariibacter sp. GS-14 TaxID=2590670 RepID=UPI00112B0DF7|nr:NAD(P)H-binding protein [Aestuariibacter sp. GS-14]TPV56547.1 NAD-dependent epimerase/dehydratase family protein [Aestuariibacter sp. GS-14]